MYFHLAEPDIIWRGSQLLICLNAVLDPIMYGIYGGNLKMALHVQCCCKPLQSKREGVFSVHTGTNLEMQSYSTVN